MLSFSVVSIRWQRFPANMLPLSFKISYDRGRLFWLTTIPFLYQRFYSSVWIRTVVPWAISGKLGFKLRVTVCFSVVVLWVNRISEDKVVLNLWLICSKFQKRFAEIMISASHMKAMKECYYHKHSHLKRSFLRKSTFAKIFIKAFNHFCKELSHLICLTWS